MKIVFFDGVCGLCNKWVDFLLDIDSSYQLKFSPLQGEHAKKQFGSNDLKLDSIIYYKDGHTYKKSSAILEILKDMGGLWSISILFRIIPSFIRDWIYSLFSKRRYVMFGKNKACRIPKAKEKSRFL